MRIGNQIKEHRVQAGFTQSQLADLIGLSGHSVISRFERGKLNPSVHTLECMSAVMNGCRFIIDPENRE